MRISRFEEVHWLRPTVLIPAGALVTFALLPLWDRFSTRFPPPLLLPDLHISYFVILLPAVWTVFWWLVAGLPGFDTLRRDPVRRLWALALLLLALWGFASNSWAFMRLQEPETALNASLQLAIVMLFAVTVACAGPSARAIILTLAGVLVLNSLITVAQAAAQQSIGLTALGEFSIGPDQRGVSVLQAEGVRWVRPLGLMPHPNMLAGTLVIGLYAAAALVVSSRRRIRLLGSAIFTLGLWALLLTFSRGAWVGFAAGGFAVLPLLFSHLRSRDIRLHVAVTLGLALAVGLAFLLAYQPFLSARVGEGSESIELRSVADRMVFLDFATRSITERPLLGVGIGNFPWRTSYYLVDTDFDLRGDNVHHVLFSAWAELGVIGLGLLVAALSFGVEAALRAFKTTAYSTSEKQWPDERVARVALLAAVMALIAVGLLDHYPWTTLHFQLAWWGGLALAGKGNLR